MAKLLDVRVVTPEREAIAVEARFVVLPAFDGEMGVLPGRAPFLARLGSGLLRVEESSGGKRSLFVSGGFAQMIENRLTFLTEEAEAPESLTPKMAQTALAEAEQLPSRSEIEYQARQGALARARAIRRLSR